MLTEYRSCFGKIASFITNVVFKRHCKYVYLENGQFSSVWFFGCCVFDFQKPIYLGNIIYKRFMHVDNMYCNIPNMTKNKVK